MAIQARILQAQVDTFQQKDLVVDQMGLLLFPEHKNSTLLNRYTQFILIEQIRTTWTIVLYPNYLVLNIN